MPPRDKIANYRTYGMYKNTSTPLLSAWQYYEFIDDIAPNDSFVSVGIIVINDSSNDIQISFDGTNVHSDVVGSERLVLDFRREQEIWIRSTPAGGGDAYRLWVW